MILPQCSKISATHYVRNNMNGIPLSSSVGESNTRLDEPTGAESMMSDYDTSSTWGPVAI